MGIKEARKLLYTFKNLTIKDLKNISLALQQHLDEEPRPPYEKEPLNIDIDCSWVAYALGAAGRTPEDAAAITCDFLQTLARYGFNVTPICDGDIRHHSKLATIQRVSQREKYRLEGVKAKYELLKLRQQNRVNQEERDGTQQLVDKNEMELEEKRLSKLASSRENKVFYD